MTSDRNVRQILTIVVLLLLTVSVGLVVIPAGVDLGYGTDSAGLSPRFIPQLATLGIALSLAFGLIQAIIGGQPDDAVTPAAPSNRHPLRAAGVSAICLLSAYLGFELLGFYIGGTVMSVALMLLLGERKLVSVIVFPVAVLLLVYVLFELGLQVRLPKSSIFPGSPI